MSRRRTGRRERPTGEEEQGGIQPKYRRAFGCVTWVNMAMLVFLGMAFLLPLPFRYTGNGEIFSEIQIRLALIGLILIVPGMTLGAILGARTYRVERHLGMQTGTGIGAVVGLTSYLLFFVLFEGTPLFIVPLVASVGLLLYALFTTGQDLKRRWQVVLFAAGISVLSGAGALLLYFDLLGLLGALFSTAAAAVGGFVGGIGYARAGGDEMLPPEAVHRKNDPRIVDS